MKAREVLAERMAQVERMCDAMDGAVDLLTGEGYDPSLHVSGNTIFEFLILFLDVSFNNRLAATAVWSEMGFTVQPHGRTKRNAVMAANVQRLLNEAKL